MEEEDIKRIGKNPYTLLLRLKGGSPIGDNSNGRILLK
jgi:hypothetical protein